MSGWSVPEGLARSLGVFRALITKRVVYFDTAPVPAFVARAPRRWPAALRARQNSEPEARFRHLGQAEADRQPSG